MSIDEGALALTQDRWAKMWHEYRDISIRTVLEYYFDALEVDQQPDEKTIKHLLIDELQTANTEGCDDYSYHGGADDLYEKLRPYLRSMKRESIRLTTAEESEAVKIMLEAMDKVKWDVASKVFATKAFEALQTRFKITRIEVQPTEPGDVRSE